MRQLLILSVSTLLYLSTNAQVAEMKWELDYQLYLKLANDSNYIYDIRDVFHISDTKKEIASDFIFYPVNPGAEYATQVPENTKRNYTTLWSALHAKTGGGWIHFTNCIAFAIETQSLDLQGPLMKRPESNWKPKPMTDSYKRTKNWDFYIPMSQKNAQKEYRLRKDEGTLGGIRSLPPSYIELFNSTNQSDYDLLKAQGKNNEVAKIDLIKVLLGANYLGEAQIIYVSNMVLEALKSYSKNMLPSVVVFEEYDAAAVMSLNASGYKIEKIVFRSNTDLREDTMEQRKQEIMKIVDEINEYNHQSFKKQLSDYYE